MLFALLAAAGSGSRMGADRPKQFLLLHGKPILQYTIECFLNYHPALQLVLVLPEGASLPASLETLIKTEPRIQIVSGGITRFHSVQNGLAVLPDEGLVFIHDAVRPLLQHDLIRRCETTALTMGNAIPVVPLKDSLRVMQAAGSHAVPRENYRLVQTPQTFRLHEIKQAYQQAYRDTFSDEASVYEAAGYPIHLTEGDANNLKITTPTDLKLAHYLLTDR